MTTLLENKMMSVVAVFPQNGVKKQHQSFFGLAMDLSNYPLPTSFHKGIKAALQR